MENMERFTPLSAIAYVITNSMENLHFDKEGYFHVLVFYWLFYKRNRKQFFLCSHRNTRGSLEELEIAWKHLSYGRICSHFNFSFSQTSTCVSINTENVLYFLTNIYCELHSIIIQVLS